MDQQQIIEYLEISEKRRDARRSFLRAAGGTTMAVAGASLLAACGNDDPNIPPAPPPPPPPSPTPTPTTALTDADVLNFALNLEYLEAQFYSYAAFGVGLPADQLTGSGVQGGVTGGRQVTFTDPLVRQYAREIANDEIAHVAFLRTALGASARVAQPAIDISGSANGAFSQAARAAGVITGANSTFDPYANDENFLLGAFIFEDVGVTAYKGASILINNKDFLEAAAGILAAEAYHAGLVRTVLYRKGIATPSLVTIAGQISDARDSLDGSSDLDQGIAARGSGASLESNIVPTDPVSGVAFSRQATSVLNIVYLNKASVSAGGFFPAGVNGTVKASANNS